MTDDQDTSCEDGLRAFALNRLGADHYPEDVHLYRALTCSACGDAGIPRSVVVETHSGTRPGNFRGIVTAHCDRCDTTTIVLSFTSEQRTLVRREALTCPCGGRRFHLAACDRYEGDEGLAGFYDEGVLVAHCPTCGRNLLVVALD